MEFRNPRVKPEHRPFRVSGNRIVIGGRVYGVGSEIVDDTGAVWTLLNTMDGTRSVDQIVSEVVAAHPGERVEAVRAGIDMLTDAGHVEDAATADGTVAGDVPLSPRERDRYDRSRRFFRWIDPTPRTQWWEPQVRLRNARVTVVGVGAAGGSAALALAATGIGHLHCVDMDVVELSNLNRQILYTEDDIGERKADVAVRRLRAVNSDIEIIGTNLEVRGEADLRVLADACDILVAAADQPAGIRVWTNRACLATGTPWVHPGYEGPKAMAAAFLPGRGACYECARLATGDPEPESRGPAVHGATAATAGIAGNLAAHLVTVLITGTAPVRSGRAFGVNVAAPEQHLLGETERRPDCPACGGT